MKIITINDVEYAVFAANEGTGKPQPHIIETLSGTVPEGKQLSLLKEYLKQNDIMWYYVKKKYNLNAQIFPLTSDRYGLI